ncbi:hypothetical protein BXY82_2081 [Gelidibacter sediminis]|uniref:Sugar transporter n=1 Tax=Gelidibacter sediminis TaxID=1608710 RepID=A0A4R7PZZ6_9FLAO|nr:hypothetical protein [Gelidibacter sediminis]TDU40042.1 hypothetical protein BXY82_2081 [Gelidibacter sediminis]
MNFTSLNKPPVYFWVVSVIAILWNAIGVYNYLSHALMTQEELSALSKSDQTLYANLPVWYISVFAIAVFAGLLGAISLLLRKRWAYIFFFISFLAVGLQQFYILTEVNPRDIFLSLTIIVIAVFLVWFSKRAVSRKWLT